MRHPELLALIAVLCFLPGRMQAKAAPAVLMAFTQNSNVYYLNLATHERTVVTTKGRDNGLGAAYPWYGWSPDGRYLALLRLNNGAGAKVPQNLLILDRTGTVLHSFAGGAGDFYPAWAVDGDQVAFVADSGYDQGHAYFDVQAADATGRVRRLWRSSSAQFCGIGEGASDPATDLYLRESTLDRSLRWSLKTATAIYSSPCSSGLQVVSLATGRTTVLGAAQWWHSPALAVTGALAVVSQSGSSSGPSTVETVEPATGDVIAQVDAGETPSWSADGKSLYYQQRTAQGTISLGTGTAAITSTRYLASVCRAPADGSGHGVIVQLHAYYLAGVSQVPGSRSVVFAAVANDSARTAPLQTGESLDASSRKANQPRVDIDEVDGSGHLSVLVPSAGLPAVQPVLVR